MKESRHLNDMKNTFLAAIALLFVSCTETSGITYFTLFNDTDKGVEVRAYNRDSRELLDVINIPPLSRYSKKQTTGFRDSTHRTFYSNDGVDSVRVIFDMSKVAVYVRHWNDGTDLGIFAGNQYQEHYITDEDVLKANPCSGDCE
ncbi:MAG: hypothetical protein JJ885_10465 [Muricauda sp.]|jgi:hypothetical protein|nr:hypothetical protein [Allomuricauda sp.]MBO6533076.1 hypothetical protein [Allomuricauda sp.]MBO6645503.1 hypothetical protein [Allomuricauda sp.]MBO6747710.1 hypothetical protein [Allomuricauda sp.]MBO6844758.1 hypothetical protein [Allomuricauda sp.]